MRDYNVVCIWQGLGNQMFQYAFARSLAIHTGRDVYIDAESLNKKIIGEELGSNTIRDYGLSNFNITLKQVDSLRRCLWNYTRKDKWYYEMVEILCEKGKYPYKYYSQKGFDDISGYNPSLDEIESNTYIKGWFQSEDYFLGIRNILLNEFTLKNSIKIPKKIKEIILKTESISVHIRRGDYKKNNMALSKDYYLKAINLISSKVVHPVWIIFSDDIEFVKNNYFFEGKAVFIDDSLGMRDFEQLMLMSKCKHNIIANSTFSWWGAWLNKNRNKYVVAPRKWFSSQRNIIPVEWIKI